MRATDGSNTRKQEPVLRDDNVRQGLGSCGALAGDALDTASTDLGQRVLQSFLHRAGPDGRRLKDRAEARRAGRSVRVWQPSHGSTVGMSQPFGHPERGADRLAGSALSCSCRAQDDVQHGERDPQEEGRLVDCKSLPAGQARGRCQHSGQYPDEQTTEQMTDHHHRDLVQKVQLR